jgi:hypothetical protein
MVLSCSCRVKGSSKLRDLQLSTLFTLLLLMLFTFQRVQLSTFFTLLFTLFTFDATHIPTRTAMFTLFTGLFTGKLRYGGGGALQVYLIGNWECTGHVSTRYTVGVPGLQMLLALFRVDLGLGLLRKPLTYGYTLSNLHTNERGGRSPDQLHQGPLHLLQTQRTQHNQE